MKSIGKWYFLKCLLCGYILIFSSTTIYADSDLFPFYEDAPALTSYVSGGTFNNVWYIAPNGSDSTGDGSINNPWASLSGPTQHCSSDQCSEATVGAGDIIYFRGGTYSYTARVDGRITASHFNIRDRGSSWGICNIQGNANDYIIIAAYPGETPIFESSNDAGSFSIHANYVVIDGLTFTSGGFFLRNAANCVIQNCSFGQGREIFGGDQISGCNLGMARNTDNTIIRNNYFGTSTNHSIKAYTSEGRSNNVLIIYNRFNNVDYGYGTINLKMWCYNWEIAYNRFEDCSTAICVGGSYGHGPHDGLNIHHNSFDKCGYLLEILKDSSEIHNVAFHNNVILNGAATPLHLRCEDGQCVSDAGGPLGQFYNNAFYNISDLINHRSTTEFINFPTFWNYNAYASASIRNTAENWNNLVAFSWGGSALIQASHGINSTGPVGNKFYTVADNSPFKGAGRYGDSIGGFTFGGGGDSSAPYTSGHSPAKGSAGFYRDSNIIVHLQDSGDGVDQSSIVMTVNGQTVSPTVTGIPSDYTLTYDPPNPLEGGDVIVTLKAQNLANPPNVMSQETYKFTISEFVIK